MRDTFPPTIEACELYWRASASRVASRIEGQPIHLEEGREDGTAVRVFASRTCGFAACSGVPHGGAAAWAARSANALRGPAVSEDAGPPWRRGGGRRLDIGERADASGEEAALPPSADLVDWLEAAWSRIRSGGVGATYRPVEARVEASITTEAWRADEGGGTLRVRARCWAVVTVCAGAEMLEPVHVACLGPTPPAIGDLLLRLEERAGLRPARPWRGGRVPVVLAPPAAARLVVRLVGALHATAGVQRPFPVGNGWAVIDDPSDHGALFGASFDDAGWDSPPLRLADGRHGLDGLARPGRLRRASFRDRPAPRPCQLVVAEGGPAWTGRAFRADSLDWHDLGRGEWLLVLEGRGSGEAEADVPRYRAHVLASPREIAERCVAAAGPARSSHLGVRTPALVFEGLELQA